MGGAGIEQFLTGGGVWQRKAHLMRRRQGEIQILLV